eukprot:TRINITY_DN11780_c0_g3_i2.p1 TRINITY_DN11780_c0_g3~~TRINITY_DN11780_c0_g3_i2.p1  ORF type:complete len:291 (+),score=64.54 TRINITY_DN11780_c0_g3_i2:149-1021(+)
MRLIVNADDFGYSRARNKGIIDAALNGIISSVSVLVSGSDADASRIECLPSAVSVGLHFNITEGRSQLRPSRIPSLIDPATQLFWGKAGFQRQADAGAIAPEEVKLELEAQYGSFVRRYGRKPSHIDGHNHVQVLHAIALVTLQFAFKQGIPVRWPCSNAFETAELSPYLTWIKHQRKSSEAQYQGSWPLRSTYFLGFTLMGQDLTVERVQEQLMQLGTQHDSGNGAVVVELMVHPGLPSINNDDGCGSGPDDFSTSLDRQHEAEVLMDPRWTAWLQAHDIELISWQQLS